jgi:uncharacterized protein HemX
MQTEENANKAVKYPTGKLTLLQSMLLLAALGIAVAVLWNHYFV